MIGKIVIDLGFGDSGKGAAIDSLAMEAESPIGIRFSGGQQCGHTVYIDKEKHHIHASFASCALRGFPTYITEHCTLYLPLIIEECHELAEKGGNTSMTVHPKCKITTPYDIAWNRLTERVNNHGSVGLGIGATMHRSLKTGYALYAMDMQYPEIARAKLRSILNYYLNRIRREDKGLLFFTVDDYMQEVELHEEQFQSSLKFWNEYVTIGGYEHLARYKTLLFEGSQGVMLDMDHGIFPNVTYANTTARNAIDVCRRLSLIPEVYYVTRCYTTRHGNGWIPNTKAIELVNTECEINILDEWQGVFRVGEIDYTMLNYALEVDSLYSSNLRKHLIVSCLDQRPGFVFDESKLDKSFQAVYHRSSPITQMLAKPSEPDLVCDKVH